MAKQGEALERLVAWIQESVHGNAVVTHDDRLIDKVTGEERQVDVSIRVPTGPDEFLAIVEVRDRKSKVSSPYIESVKSKRDAVGADAAFVVSRSGFFRPAVTKARFYGIRTYTLDEATEADWSQWLGLRTFTVLERKFGATSLTLALKGSTEVINISPRVLELLQSEPASKVLTHADGAAAASIPDLVSTVVNYFVSSA